MSDYSYVPKEVTSFLGLVDTYVRWGNQVRDAGQRKYFKYHPSEWGKCLRQQQYKHYVQLGYLGATEEVFDSRMLRLFGKGHNMHSRWTRYFDEMGILKGYWKCSNQGCGLFDNNGKLLDLTVLQISKIFADKKTRIYGKKEKFGVFRPDKCACGCTEFEYMETDVKSDSLNISGHCDVLLDCTHLKEDAFKGVRSTYNDKYLPRNGQMVVGDMKTISSSAWKNQLEKKGPHSYYLVQLTCYIHILGCDYGLLMYENKDNSHMKWYKVERNDEWWEAIQWQANEMQAMAKAVDANGKLSPKLPPPRPTAKSSYDCKGCGFRGACHKSKIWTQPNIKEARAQFYKCLL